MHASGGLWILLALSVATFQRVSAQMDTIDKTNWHKAVRIYQAQHRKGEFESYRTNKDTYAKVPDLEAQALAHAKATGVIPVARYTADESAAAGTLATEKIYFSSAIQPGEDFHRHLGLHDQNALAFWKYEKGRFHLLQIDTLGNFVIKWPVRPLEDVVGHH